MLSYIKAVGFEEYSLRVKLGCLKESGSRPILESSEEKCMLNWTLQDAQLTLLLKVLAAAWRCEGEVRP